MGSPHCYGHDGEEKNPYRVYAGDKATKKFNVNWIVQSYAAIFAATADSYFRLVLRPGMPGNSFVMWIVVVLGIWFRGIEGSNVIIFRTKKTDFLTVHTFSATNHVLLILYLGKYIIESNCLWASVQRLCEVVQCLRPTQLICLLLKIRYRLLLLLCFGENLILKYAFCHKISRI
jgi:hypothetical protein